MKRAISMALAAALLGVMMTPAGAAIDKSKGIKVLAEFRYKGTNYPPETSDDYFIGGTDIAFKGRFIYAMQQGENGGVHVFKHRKRGAPRKVSFIPCPGSQNDVAVVKRGLIAVGYHNSTCAGGNSQGIRLIDVSDPKNAKYLGSVDDLPGGTHTLTKYPGKPIIYASPGGLANGNAIEQIIDVSDPNKPKVVSTYTPNPTGCHDVTFHVKKDKKLAFCAGGGETQIWDVSDPLHPVTIAHIPQPQMVFPHSVAVTFDGKYMIVGDENFGSHECEGGPTGALWIYNIENPMTPEPMGYYSIPRGQDSTASSRANWCTAHLFNFVRGTYVMVASWYAAGMNVIDFSDMANPKEIRHYMGTGKDYTNYWSAYWHRGRIYANDRTRGLDVFQTRGLHRIKPQG
ncbi:MAG: hypothetical protein KY391_07780 [Actinobacteria bacterium]|nr:hypothetical protein [Actinomycetota bacterium]